MSVKIPWRALCSMRETRQRKILHDITYMGNLKKKSNSENKVENWLPGAEGQKKQEESGKKGINTINIILTLLT